MNDTFENWMTIDIYTHSADQVDMIRKLIEPELNHLSNNKKINDYYFAHYRPSKENDRSVPIFKIVIERTSITEEEMKEKIEALKRKHEDKVSELKFHTEHNPIMVDNYPDIRLAGIARKTKDILCKEIGYKPTLNQMRSILHYIFNQTNYRYFDEIKVYLSLINDNNYKKSLTKEQIKYLETELKKILYEIEDQSNEPKNSRDNSG